MRWIADNVLSPLGGSTAENYHAVKAGRSALRRYERWRVVLEPFAAALFDDSATPMPSVDGLTRFESLACTSVMRAVSGLPVDIASPRVLFILSTTKGNIELMDGDTFADEVLTPAVAARRIAHHLGLTTQPVVVCNACISGVASIVLAQRLLDAGLYDYAIVCGADVQCPFTISGFQSLKALSAEECRPFDIERTGMNLGEAAATIVFQRDGLDDRPDDSLWRVVAGAVCNDAWHISSPSKNGEGARRCLQTVLASAEMSDLAFINAHGTATLFNDQMESVAIERAGLGEIPVNALKGCFGHTLGAAGVLETILSKAALDDHTILATHGFEERGVSGKIAVTTSHHDTEKGSFIKMISGFGGGNAAILVTKNPVGKIATKAHQEVAPAQPAYAVTHTVHLTPSSLTVDWQPLYGEGEGKALLTDLYKRYLDDYPKYYKMDGLSRLGFVAAQLLLRAEGWGEEASCADRAVILFNHTSSVEADKAYEATIHDADNYYPSPSAFVYTLPNIVTGEIAIRNQYHGETSFYILDHRDEALMRQVVVASLSVTGAPSAVAGWVDYLNDHVFEAELKLMENSKN